jgi:hypothetical protein
VSATEGGALTEQAQRQGTRALTDGSGCRARVREAVSRDLGRVIKIGRGGSDRGGMSVGGTAPSRGSEVTGVGQRGGERHGELSGRVVATSPRLEGEMAGKRPRAGRRNSGEGFRPWGEGSRRAKAWDSFSSVRGNSRTDAGALGRTKSAGHRAGAADRHGRTPAKPKLADNKAKLGKLSMGTGVSPQGGAQGGLARSPAS